ncbi:MFS transporter [Pontibacterium sp. N1Y112]|uniref:MFS transporter n=1 Tax=Pontibacterium sinense TaxID=2781979 RepID=A0A8J7K6R1_9GAMM|nr:MFS transporter [Pontibacterium sinense]MBE9397316.1 MFS transporter [Pontibacterium sinense]
MQEPQASWRESLGAFLHPRVVVMLFLGFSAGIPILLIFSSLSLWLREAGVERAAITFFSWAALGYSFKFVWAPLVDQLPVPWLSRWLGRRRSWLLVAQFAIIAAIGAMASIDPALGPESQTAMALAAVALGFSSATQDIVIDAYRIEAADTRLQSMMSATYIAGYRVAMVVAGAGALVLASGFGTELGNYQYNAWSNTYWIMAAVMLVGIATTLIIKEPALSEQRNYTYSALEYGRFCVLFALALASFILCFYFTSEQSVLLKEGLAEFVGNQALGSFVIEALRLVLAACVSFVVAGALLKTGLVQHSMVDETYVAPVRDFFDRYGVKAALFLLLLVGSYRISDIVLGVISNVFYLDMGFSKEQIATAVKTFGVVMAIVGGFLGGLLAMRQGVMRILFLGAFLSAVTNLLFMILADKGADLLWLYIVVAADNLSAGLAGAAFVAFLSSLTSISFTAMQYAIFSSLMTLLPKVLGGYSGSIVDSIGYDWFFIFTTLIGLPVLLLIVMARHWIGIDVLPQKTAVKVE